MNVDDEDRRTCSFPAVGCTLDGVKPTDDAGDVVDEIAGLLDPTILIILSIKGYTWCS